MGTRDVHFLLLFISFWINMKMILILKTGCAYPWAEQCIFITKLQLEGNKISRQTLIFSDQKVNISLGFTWRAQTTKQQLKTLFERSLINKPYGGVHNHSSILSLKLNELHLIGAIIRRRSYAHKCALLHQWNTFFWLSKYKDFYEWI